MLALNIFRSFLKRHPFLSNSIVYGGLYVGAELSQQLLSTPVETKKNVYEAVSTVDMNYARIDYAALGRYAVMGTFLYAPSLYVWYKWLDNKYRGTAKTIIVRKLILDQFLLTPYLLVVFFTGMSLMENAKHPFAELKQKFLPTFMSSCAFWIPMQTLNFAVIAPQYRVMFMGVSGFIWINILCLLKRQRFNTQDN